MDFPFVKEEIKDDEKSETDFLKNILEDDETKIFLKNMKDYFLLEKILRGCHDFREYFKSVFFSGPVVLRSGGRDIPINKISSPSFTKQTKNYILNLYDKDLGWIKWKTLHENGKDYLMYEFSSTEKKFIYSENDLVEVIDESNNPEIISGVIKFSRILLFCNGEIDIKRIYYSPFYIDTDPYHNMIGDCEDWHVEKFASGELTKGVR